MNDGLRWRCKNGIESPIDPADPTTYKPGDEDDCVFCEDSHSAVIVRVVTAEEERAQIVSFLGKDRHSHESGVFSDEAARQIRRGEHWPKVA